VSSHLPSAIMPEVRHGSTSQAASVPDLPSNQPGSVASPTAADQPHQRPLQQTNTQSADNVPITQNLTTSPISDQTQPVVQFVEPPRTTDLPQRPSLRIDNSNDEASTINAIDHGASPISPSGRRRSSIFPPIMPVDPAPRQSLSY